MVVDYLDIAWAVPGPCEADPPGALQITVGWMADRNGRTFPDGLEPDEAVAYAPGADGKDDSVVQAAKTWLAKQPACSA